MEDAEIVELYLTRDERAIRETGSKYGRLCYRVAFGILRDPEDSEECVNDTYLNTWNAIPPARPVSFSAFLCKIARNLSLKRLDYELAQKRSPELLTSFEELEEVLADDQIGRELEDREIGRAISRFLRQEKPEARNVFIRKYWFLDPIETIAQDYGFSEGKVKTMLHRTRKRLKAYLQKEGIEG